MLQRKFLFLVEFMLQITEETLQVQFGSQLIRMGTSNGLRLLSYRVCDGHAVRRHGNHLERVIISLLDIGFNVPRKRVLGQSLVLLR